MNTQDITVVVASGIGMAAFLFVQGVLFRITKASVVAVRPVILCSYLTGLSTGTVLVTIRGSSIPEQVVLVAAHLILYTAVVFAYLLSVFILFDSSIRMKYLLRTGMAKNGLRIREVHRMTSLADLIPDRIIRLVKLNVIENRNGRYFPKPQTALVELRRIAIEWMNTLLG